LGKIALRSVQLRPRSQLKSHFGMAGSPAHRAIHLVLFEVRFKERAMNTDPIELVDLGDATQETKQLVAIPIFLDSAFYLGLLPDLG
jgi:hypothetical protein